MVEERKINLIVNNKFDPFKIKVLKVTRRRVLSWEREIGDVRNFWMHS